MTEIRDLLIKKLKEILSNKTANPAEIKAALELAKVILEYC